MTAAHHPHRNLVASLFGTLKLMQMYGRQHDATHEAVQKLHEALLESADGAEDVAISLRGSRLQINERTMRASECGNLALSYIAEEWSRRQIAAVHVHVEAEVTDLEVFIDSFLEVAQQPQDSVEMLNSTLAEEGIKTIAVERRDESEADPVLLEERRDVTMRSYLRGLRAFKDVLRGDGFPDRAKVRRARRAVQGLVDCFIADEAAVLTLAQIRGHDARLFRHCMNVSIYAVATGQRLGMSRRQLGELGLAALFHDLGKTVPVEKAPGETDGQARRRAIKDHPSQSARMLLMEGASQEGMLKAAIAAFEQYAHFDGSGHPPVSHELHLFSRVITIADCYDALTSPRVKGERVHTPYEAFRLMQARAGTIFDPALLKVFLNALGAYPVGTVVSLSTGEVAIVTSGPTDPTRLDCPCVRVHDTAEGTLAPHTTVDLAAGRPDGAPLRTIRATLPATEVFASVGELVAAV